MQRRLDFTDRELLSDYQKYLYDVRKLVNAQGEVTRDVNMSECDIHSPRAHYFPLSTAKTKVLGLGSEDRRRFRYRLNATLCALNDKWQYLSVEDSKDLMTKILHNFSEEFETGPSSFAPSLQSVRQALTQRTRFRECLRFLGGRKKRVSNLIYGICGGKLPTTPEIGLLVVDEAIRRLDDPNLAFFATHGDWKMVRRYLYHNKIRVPV